MCALKYSESFIEQSGIDIFECLWLTHLRFFYFGKLLIIHVADLSFEENIESIIKRFIFAKEAEIRTRKMSIE
jgi:hypothetical protein